MPDLFDNINEWLLNQALGEDDISTTVQGMAERLQEGGIPITRISMGRPALHPVIGLIDMQWYSDIGRVEVSTVPRKALTLEWLETIRRSPFFDLANGSCERIVADLSNPSDVKRYDIFEKFAVEGLTGYAAFYRKFGREQDVWSSLEVYLRGATVSFGTRRFSGFAQSDIDGLERLVSSLCVCARVDSDRFLTNEILSAYLGNISSKSVLKGRIARGDGEEIDCAIFYSDLFGSIPLSRRLDADAYLETVNTYFECTINAVSDHGGEVLKLIGDGILAIFPFDDKNRSKGNMCAAALASAREAFMRAKNINAKRADLNLPSIEFGVALHLGNVIYGNVGTEKRLDFTATGPAVGIAARVESLTRKLGEPLLATREFADACPSESSEMPDQLIKGFDVAIKLVKYQV